LDTTWRRTAAGYPANTDLRIETRGGRDEIVVTPLDAEAEPASLAALRGEVERLLPEVEIADLPLEAHGWTGFLGEYTHISGTDTREVHLPESLSALLVSESCNVGLTPVVDENYPPLSRERLNWAGHNHLRSATHAAANVRLAGFHTPLPLAQAWGGGEIASADGMRFVIPVSTINTAYNPATSAGNAAPRCIHGWPTPTPCSRTN
jgi:Tn3 transposase DDE domain